MKDAKIPKVRLARPAGRPFQLRYTCPEVKREIRITIGTRDEAEALEHKSKLEAKLLLGIDAKPKRRVAGSKHMSWEDFRQRYFDLQLSTLRESSRYDSEVRLDVVERILKPRTLGDVADRDALHDLQNRLLAGEEESRSRKNKTGRPRSPHTVRTYMAVLMAALHWAEYMGWLPAVPKIRKVKVSKLRHMKGRPITSEEFERMLAVTPKIVGGVAADSWGYLLRGLWESGLRIGELLDMSWDDATCIMPVWRPGALAVLDIPADKQKNDTEEAIPLLPGFESALLEIPTADRSGHVFNPMSLQIQHDRPVRHGRPTSRWVADVVRRIGCKAGVVVQPARGGKPPKTASAHDLRRSCAERLIDAGVPEREVSRVLRHQKTDTTRRYYAPGNVQKSAGKIRLYLGTVPREEPVEVVSNQP